MVSALHNFRPAIAGAANSHGERLYCHPLIYRNRTLCWEAERERRHDCLAVQNFHGRRKLQLQDQVCTTCNMRAYANVVVVQLRRGASKGKVAN